MIISLRIPILELLVSPTVATLVLLKHFQLESSRAKTSGREHDATQAPWIHGLETRRSNQATKIGLETMGMKARKGELAVGGTPPVRQRTLTNQV